MTERQIINALLDLLSDESKWTKGAYARDAEGNTVRPESADACCWCLDGAMMRVTGAGSRAFSAWQGLVSACGEVSPVVFNDNSETTFEDVRNLLLEVRDQFND